MPSVPYLHAHTPLAYIGGKRSLKGEWGEKGKLKKTSGDDEYYNHPVLSLLMTELFNDTRPERQALEYREPFLGGGYVALKFLGRTGRHAWLNDCDPGTAAYWNAVLRAPKQLKNKLKDKRNAPDKDKFLRYKAELDKVYEKHKKEPFSPGDMNTKDVVDLAFVKFAVTQWSHAGKGENYSKKALEMRSANNPELSSLMDRIDAASATLNAVRLRHGAITCLDYKSVVDDPEPSYVFCDPPYTMADDKVYYAFNFTDDQHKDLASRLRKRKHWCLTYDVARKILEFYNVALVPKGNFTCEIVKSGSGMNSLGARKREELFMHDD